MHWLLELIRTPSVAQTALVLALVIGVGLAVGAVHVRKIGLGVAGVLFAGLVAGDLLARAGIDMNEHMLDLAREGGLVLFVYTIGMQVGPGFFASLRREGLPLNLMAAAVVLLGAITTVGIVMLGAARVPVAAGLFAGATTNTPSLAAAQQALKDVPPDASLPGDAALPGMAYAVAYPFGIVGIILTMLLTKLIFRINPQREAAALESRASREAPPLRAVTLEVTNSNLDNLPLSRIPLLVESGVTVSRVRTRDGAAHVARGDTVLHAGDLLHAVGTPQRLEQLRLIVGRESPENLAQSPGDITSRRILVTKPAALGATVAELNLAQRFGVTVTRVARAGVELPPANVRLQFGDTLTVVGDPHDIARVARDLGDSIKRLDHPQIIPLFIGIALGVIVGSWPLHLGLPAPVRLGLAGGPLIVAILLSRLGNVGPLVWYISPAANFMLREFGIVLFLACVGIRSGGGFLETLTTGGGLAWIPLAAIITLAPILLVALVARAVYQLNYLPLCGLLAGSMTDPPALAFANQMTGSESPLVAYVTVYPLVMLLRVLSAQVMVMMLMG